MLLRTLNPVNWLVTKSSQSFARKIEIFDSLITIFSTSAQNSQTTSKKSTSSTQFLKLKKRYTLLICQLMHEKFTSNKKSLWAKFVKNSTLHWNPMFNWNDNHLGKFPCTYGETGKITYTTKRRRHHSWNRGRRRVGITFCSPDYLKT